MIFLLIYFFHQSYFILLGGTTWDEPASILAASKQLYKAYLFLVDFNNPLFDVYIPQETYGALLFIPAYLLTSSSVIMNLFSKLFSNIDLVNHTNELEVALVLRHLFLNFYIIIVLYICFRKIKEIYSLNRAILIIITLLLVPSFNGHSLFNFADIPFAIQFFLAALFFLSYLNNYENKNLIILGILFGLALLTRLSAIAFLSFLPLFEILHNYIRGEPRNFFKIVKNLITKYVKIYSVALITLYLGTPSAWKNPFAWLKEGYIYQFNHPNNVPSLLNGKEIFAYEVPRTYLIQWFGFKLPLLFIFLAFLSLFLFFTKKSLQENELLAFSLFFIFLVNVAFFLYHPVAYDGIRHYLFLIPFFVIVVLEPLNYLLEKNISLGSLGIISFTIYLITIQSGLGPYKYVYLNELVDEKTISVDCKEYIAQNGCGEWHTDYWGFGGKNLYNLSENYPNQIKFFCPPQFTYSLFQNENRPWELINGSFVFDDLYPFETDAVYYYKSDMLKFINSPNFTNIEFISLNYHRPPGDNCGMSELDEKRFEVECSIVDKTTAFLRGYEITINYLSKCTVSKNI